MIAIIPARGGSKRIPRKNLQEIGGETLVAIAIRHAKALGLRPYVSTEDHQIAAEAIRHGANVIDRPRHLSADDVGTIDVLRHVVEQIDSDDQLYALLQPTVPGRDVVAIDSWLRAGQIRPALTAYPCTHFVFGSTGVGIEYLNRYQHSRPRSQEMTTQYVEDGGFYVFDKDYISASPDWLDPETAKVIVSRKSIDIDSHRDLAMCIAMAGRGLV